jgi:UDP-2,3-diacylglucosamine hydrolase
LGDKRVLLVHGDRYCTKDKSHQWFRKLTRNDWFPSLFLSLPLVYRNRLVNKVRNYSQNVQKKSEEMMDVVHEDVVKHMLEFNADILIHGHTHKPGVNMHKIKRGQVVQRYVLSDWDDSPDLLCYDNTKGFYFVRI